MANILVLGVKVPFTSGGQEVLVRTLIAELKKREHNADLLELPFEVAPKEGLLKQAALWRSFNLTQFGDLEVDLIISTKFPTYYAKHPKKSLWLVHQHRAIYDLYGGRFSDFSDDPRDEELRKMLVSGDQQVIREASYVSGISKNVINRLENFSGIKGDVLYPPLPQGSAYYNRPEEDYILSVGRICSIKRVDLMIKSLPIIHNFVKLKITGTADEPGVMKYLKSEIDKHHLWDRVEFLGRVSNEELLDLYAKSLAVYYAPHNEDYGYVTLEAMASEKPVITATDSGGTLEFVKHEGNGLILEPDTDSMGHGINRLVENKQWAAELGQNGKKLIEESGLADRGWDLIVDGLLSPLDEA